MMFLPGFELRTGASNCGMVTSLRSDELSPWERSIPQRKFRQEFPVRWSEQKRFFGIE